MASRASLIQSRSIYVGTSNAVAPSDGNLIVTGNVGIGTTAPGAKLHVSGGGQYISASASATAFLRLYSNAQTSSQFEIGQGFATTTDNIAYLWNAANASMVFGTNSAERMRITSAGNVGIGTTSPGAKLQVEGTGVGSVGTISIKGANAHLGMLSAGGSFKGWYGYFNSSTHGSDNDLNIKTGYAGTSNIRFSTNGDTTAAMMIITSAGNVGIGTTSPDAALQIYSGLKLYSNGVFTWGASSNYGTLTWDGAKTIIKAQASRELHLGANNSNSNVVIDTTGNVGIGTTSPGYKLDVRGAINSSTATTSGTGTLNLGTTDQPRIAGQITGIQSPSYTATGKLGFSVTTWGAGTDYGLTEVMAIDMRGADSKAPTIWMNPFGGNVGIGTTSPSTPLEIVHSNGNAFIVRTNDSTAANNAGFILANVASATQSSRRSVFVMDANGANGSGVDYTYFDVYGNGVTSIVNAKSDGILAFGTADTERMRITAAGNVGIGTTSPFARLQVNSGNIGAYNNISTDGAQLYLGDTNFSNSSYWNSAPGIGAVYAPGTSVAGDLAFYVYTGAASSRTERMRIVTGGNVGIGTTNPTGKLHIAQSNSGGVAAILLSEDESTIQGPSANTQIRMGSNLVLGASNIMTFGTNGSERMRVTADGSLLVGATNPDVGGSVKGTIIREDGSIVAARNIASPVHYQTPISADRMNTMGDGIMYSMWREGIFQAGIGATNASNMTFFTGDNYSASERMRITAAGNVGIGTTSPGSKLEIKTGSAYTGNSDTNIKLTNAGYRDGELNTYTEGSYFTHYFENFTGGNGRYYDRALDIVVKGSPDGTYGESVIKFKLNPITNGSNVAEVMRITGAGRVGIGTTSPTEKLVVTGAIRSTNQSNNFNTGGVSAFMDIINGSKLVRIGSVTGGDTLAGSEGDVGIFTRSNEAVRITSAGNVGIGTTSPSAKLEIQDAALDYTSALFNAQIITTTPQSIDRGGSFAFGGQTGGGGATQFGAIRGGKENSIFAETGGYLSFMTRANASPITEKMRITSAGNVGIGTTSPIHKLEVAGTVLINHPNPALILKDSSDDDDHYIQFLNNADSVYYQIDTAGDTWNFNSLLARSIKFGTAGSDRLVITGAGNVGIGTSSPTSLIHLSSNNSTYEANGVLSVSGGVNAIFNSTERFIFNIDSDNTQTDRTFDIAANRTGSSGGTLLFRVQENGNVGIGTTSPSTLLNVMTATNAVDVLRLDNSGGNSGSVQGVTHLAINHFGTGTNPSTRITAYQDGVSGWPGGMYFSTRSLNTDSAPVERMRITSAGNVGIGTTSPQYMLDVNGDAQINASGTGPSYAYVPDGGFGVDSLVTSGVENVALGKPDVWLRIHVDGVAFVFPGYQEP